MSFTEEQLQQLRALRDALAKRMPVTGAVYNLPVHYGVQYPPQFLVRKDGTGLRSQCRKAETIVGNSRWYNSKKQRYYNPERQESEVIISAKVRPFVICQWEGLQRQLRQTVAPLWYSQFIVGFPICSVKPWMRKNKKYYAALRDNRFIFAQYLAQGRNESLGSEKESFAVLSWPTVIQEKYFTDYRGNISDQDLEMMLEKFLACMGYRSPTMDQYIS